MDSTARLTLGETPLVVLSLHWSAVLRDWQRFALRTLMKFNSVL